MRAGSLQTALLVAAMVAVGVLSWSLQLRPPLLLDVSPLAALPPRVGSWRSAEVPLEATVESILRADFNVQRAYVHPVGGVVWLYIGYYGTERGGRPEHTPEVCYRSQGWEITSRRSLEVTPGRTGLRVNEYVVEQAGERVLVHFWFRSHRRTGMLGPVDQLVDRVIGRLLGGRADGSLVRVSTSAAPGEDVPARTRLLQFAAALDEQLEGHWPLEFSDPGGAGASVGARVRHARGPPNDR